MKCRGVFDYMKLSFVIPIYNSEKTITDVVLSLIDAVKTLQYEYEIILVNDGSRDNSYGICQNLSIQLNEVKAFTLTRNFGQACALMAGFSQADGDYIICLDDDLQTPPSEFPKLLNTLIAGNYDLVYGFYLKKKHSAFRNIGAGLNEFMQNRVIKMPKDLHTSSYFAVKREIVTAVVEYKQPYPYLPGLFYRVTHNICSIPIEHHSRQIGKSGYNLKKLINLWKNGLLNFSYITLKLATVAGLMFLMVSVILLVVSIIQNAWNRALIILTFLFFIGGVQLLSIGLLGEYIGRMYMGINGTPQYVISSQQIQQKERNLK